jgi:NAD(P)H-hydrate epimerase
VDADALNALAEDPAPVKREATTILTPHPGELGRWSGRPADQVDADRVLAAREAARAHGCTVLLKGSPTVVAGPDGETHLNLTGNPGLATGGSGDVLTGVLGSLLAQGVDPATASRAAPFLHGLAADWAARDLGERGLVPGDLLRYVPLAVREIAAGRGVDLLERIDHRYGDLLAATGGGA